MTIEDIAAVLTHLTEKLNRVEANVAQAYTARPDHDDDGMEKTFEEALEAIDQAVEAQAQTNRLLVRIASEIRNGR